MTTQTKLTFAQLNPGRDHASAFQVGDTVHPRASMHPDFDRWHVIYGEKRHAKEQATLEQKIAEWCQRTAYIIEAQRPGTETVRDVATGKRYEIYTFLLVKAN